MTMGFVMNDTEIRAILERARDGDRQAQSAIFTQFHGRLLRMVELRLDSHLRARLDPADVLQEAYLEIASRLAEYLSKPHLPLFLWLRLVVGEHIINLHRHHLGTQMRDPRQEVSLYPRAMPMASSEALAAQLLGRLTSPTQAVVRAERLRRLQDALNTLAPIDREILTLRHFEQMTRSEAAQELGIEEAAANRYVRALKRLKEALANLPGGLDGIK